MYNNKINRYTLIVFILLSYFLVGTKAIAADSTYRLLHNDQDYLIVGEIIDINEADEAIVSVKDNIVSLFNPLLKIKNSFFYPRQVTLKKFQYPYPSYKIPAKGDFILASINRVEGDIYQIGLGGVYRVDSLECETLSLYREPDSYPSEEIAAVIKCFVNSYGIKYEFNFRNDKVTHQLFLEGEEQVYPGSKYGSVLISELTESLDRHESVFHYKALFQSIVLAVIFLPIVYSIYRVTYAQIKRRI